MIGQELSSMWFNSSMSVQSIILLSIMMFLIQPLKLSRVWSFPDGAFSTKLKSIIFYSFIFNQSQCNFCQSHPTPLKRVVQINIGIEQYLLKYMLIHCETLESYNCTKRINFLYNQILIKGVLVTIVVKDPYIYLNNKSILS